MLFRRSEGRLLAQRSSSKFRGVADSGPTVETSCNNRRQLIKTFAAMGRDFAGRMVLLCFPGLLRCSPLP